MTSKIFKLKQTALVLASVFTLSSPAWADEVPVNEGYLLGADNNQIFYREIGKEAGKSKETIIYLHGGPGFDLNDGGYELDPLAEDYRVIVYDQRGGGYSEAIADPANLSAERHVADIEAIRAHFGIDKFTLMGQSWGSGLGMMYADAHPEQLNRLILLAPMPIRETMWNYRFAQTGKLLTAEQNQAFFEAATADLTNATVEEIIANCEIYIPLVFEPYISPVSDWANMKGDYCDSDPEGMKRRWGNNAATMASIAGFDWRDIATNYQGPTYILDGEWSMVPLNTTREWGAYLPNSQVEIVKNSGHLLWLDNPKALFKNIEAFMEGEWPKGSAPLEPTELDLLSRYTFDGNLLNDMDNRFHANHTGSIVFGKDRHGNPAGAAHFSTQASNLTVATPVWGAEPKNWTWTAWVNFNSQASVERKLLSQGDSVKLGAVGGKLRFSVAGVQVEDNSAMTANTWTHVSVVQDGDSIRLYRNGQLVAQANGTDLPGLTGDFTMQNFAGGLDDVRVYSGSLSQSRIEQIYQY